jgi:hypothetical protein
MKDLDLDDVAATSPKAKTELEELRAIARRYVWLRDECVDSKNPQHTWIVESPADLWDEAIDAAMNAIKLENEHGLPNKN